jgi:hypothetical protein
MGAGADGHGVDGYGVDENTVAGRAADGLADDGRGRFGVRQAVEVQVQVSADRPAFSPGPGKLGLAPGSQFQPHPGFTPLGGPGEPAHRGDRQHQARDHRHDHGHGVLEGPPGGKRHDSGPGQGGDGTATAAAGAVNTWAAHRGYFLSGRNHRHTRINRT